MLILWFLAAVFICLCLYAAALVMAQFDLPGITRLPPGLVYRSNR